MIRLTNEGLDAKRVRFCMRRLQLNECTHSNILAVFGIPELYVSNRIMDLTPLNPA